MIQDIAPRHFLNQYHHIQPAPSDTALCFQARRVWLRADESFPKCGDFPAETAFRYLFAIDGERFFLALTEDELTGSGLVSHSLRKLRYLRPMDRALAGYTGQHLWSWYQNNRFCGRCGAETIPGTDERKLVCPQCGNTVYPRINPAVIAAVTDGDRLLMTRYANGPVQRFVLIAGFTEIGETAEETVAREVREEVGLRVKHIRYCGSQPWGSAGNLTLGYFCELDGADSIRLEQQELSDARWFRRDEVPVPEDDTSLTSEMVRNFAAGLWPEAL